MERQAKLSGAERDFFHLVYEAGVANPFGHEREEIELKIAGLYPDATRAERTAAATEAVARHIAVLEAENRADASRYEGDDQRLVRAVFLFEFFYGMRKKFDQSIIDQIQAGDTPARVSFAPEAYQLLLRRGFSEKDTRRYFALSYQLRRAYFFINRHLIGRSPVMRQLRRQLWENVFTHNLALYDRYLWNRMEDFSTLLLGGTGTGKGTAAMAIGRSGFIPYNEKKRCFEESFTRSFVSLNLSQFPETLIESELFGHKKGAFTGAVKNYSGIFERCSPFGAILLDEIGEVPNHLQIKLLQVLQERVFTPVGSHEKSRFEGRVIAATNRSIAELRQQGLFRDDFYYRLCSDMITVPPLRQRIEEDARELDDLVAFTLERLVGQPSPELAVLVRETINRELGPSYDWPGNVRELEQCVRRVLLRRTYEGDVTPASPDLEARLAEGIARGDIAAADLVSGYCALLYRRHGTFEEVARRTGLDRRTVKKYIVDQEESGSTDGD
ncbi:MAG: sigma 54-interacting transcriptional regulator [Desulfobacteraceae bacterium]|jgi:DNA-binding NtrC family response regulator|nr:sigma 54-interacting transcriptional regulator [Desulfobacteraceae bacterium]